MVGQNIRQLRERLHLTRREFGEKIGVSGDVINNWERERVKIPEMSLKLIAATFHIEEEWLRTGIHSAKVDSINELFPETKELIAELTKQYNMDASGVALLRAVVRAFECLSPDQRDEILDSLFSDLQSAIEKKHTVDPAAHLVPDPQSPADPESSVAPIDSSVG